MSARAPVKAFFIQNLWVLSPLDSRARRRPAISEPQGQATLPGLLCRWRAFEWRGAGAVSARLTAEGLEREATSSFRSARGLAAEGARPEAETPGALGLRQQGWRRGAGTWDRQGSQLWLGSRPTCARGHRALPACSSSSSAACLPSRGPRAPLCPALPSPRKAHFSSDSVRGPDSAQAWVGTHGHTSAW